MTNPKCGRLGQIVTNPKCGRMTNPKCGRHFDSAGKSSIFGKFPNYLISCFFYEVSRGHQHQFCSALVQKGSTAAAAHADRCAGYNKHGSLTRSVSDNQHTQLTFKAWPADRSASAAAREGQGPTGLQRRLCTLCFSGHWRSTTCPFGMVGWGHLMCVRRFTRVKHIWVLLQRA